jgi:hypothetical protein
MLSILGIFRDYLVFFRYFGHVPLRKLPETAGTADCINSAVMMTCAIQGTLRRTAQDLQDKTKADKKPMHIILVLQNHSLRTVPLQAVLLDRIDRK